MTLLARTAYIATSLWYGHNARTYSRFLGAFAKRFHHATNLVPHDHGRFASKMGTMIAVNFRPADTGTKHPNQCFTGTRYRFRAFHKFKTIRFRK